MKKTGKILGLVFALSMLMCAGAFASAEPSSEEPSAEPVTQAFAETVMYNDTTYGYGVLELYITGEASSDGEITIESVTWYGYDVMYYMTEAIEAELDDLLTEAGVIPAASGEPSGEASDEPLQQESFAAYVTYNDTTYGYGLVDLYCAGVVWSDGSIDIYSVSWFGEEISGMMTPDIEAELDALLVAAGVVYGA